MIGRGRFVGAVIDGPLMGNNLAYHSPVYRVAITVRASVVQVASSDFLKPIPFEYIEYRFNETIEAWTCNP